MNQSGRVTFYRSWFVDDILLFTIWFWEDIFENWFTFYWRWFRWLGRLMLRHLLTSIQVRLSHILWSSHVIHSNKGQSVYLGASHLSALIALETEVALFWRLALPAILTRHRGELAQRETFLAWRRKSPSQVRQKVQRFKEYQTEPQLIGKQQEDSRTLLSVRSHKTNRSGNSGLIFNTVSHKCNVQS